MIEWVENAEVFSKLIHKQLHKKNLSEVFDNAFKDFDKFIKKVGKGSANDYAALQKYSRDEVIPHHQKLVHYFPNDLLRFFTKTQSSKRL